MSGIEFLDGPDVGPADEPAPDPARPAWRRWSQPVALAVIAGVAAAAVISGLGVDSPAPAVRDAEPATTPTVHIYRYAPWHSRAIPYGGGSYIY